MADYSRDEAEEILRRAMAREHSDGVAHEDLVAAAAEVGIDPAEVERAALELADEQRLARRSGEVRHELKRRFWQDVGNTLGFNGLMLAIDLLSGPGFWVQWVALFSALHLIGRAIRSFTPSEETLRKAEARLERRERKARKRERAKAWARDLGARSTERDRDARGKEAGQQFERVVEEGVEALLRKAADGLERYNRDQRGPRVRVEDPQEVASEERAAHTQRPHRRR